MPVLPPRRCYCFYWVRKTPVHWKLLMYLLFRPFGVDQNRDRRGGGYLGVDGYIATLFARLDRNFLFFAKLYERAASVPA